jgi:hypothetical protein
MDLVSIVCLTNKSILSERFDDAGAAKDPTRSVLLLI